MYTILLQVTKCSYLPIVIDELDLFNANPPYLLLSCPFYKDTYIFPPQPSGSKRRQGTISSYLDFVSNSIPMDKMTDAYSLYSIQTCL